jgi:predicted Rossmann-fold nucleotide-binding protein
LLNISGYWQPLTALIDHVIAEGFADASLRGHFRVVDSVAQLDSPLTEALSAHPRSDA